MNDLIKVKVRRGADHLLVDPAEGSEESYLVGRPFDEEPDVADDVSGTRLSGCQLQHHAEQKNHTQRLSALPHDPQNMFPDTGGVQVQRSHWLAGSRQKELNLAAGISRCSRSFGIQR